MARGQRVFDVSQGRCREARRGDLRRVLHGLLQQRRRLVLRHPPERTLPSDLLDSAQECGEERLWLAVLSCSEGMRGQIVAAAERLAAGHYGVCADCEERIPLARLQVLPFALRCLPCQERFESRGQMVFC